MEDIAEQVHDDACQQDDTHPGIFERLAVDIMLPPAEEKTQHLTHAPHQHEGDNHDTDKPQWGQQRFPSCQNQ